MALIKSCLFTILLATALLEAVAEPIDISKAENTNELGEMISDWKVRGSIQQNYDYEEEPAPAREAKMKISNGLELLPTKEGEIQQGGALSLVTDFVAIGYNFLKGNPEGVGLEGGGLDPGLKLTRRIFKFTYTEGKEVYYKGQRTSVPDQVNFQQVHSCSSAQKVNVYSGTSSYQKKLDLNINAEGGGSYGLFSFRFSLSAGYSQARARTSTSREVVMDKMVVCNAGRARYLLDTALNNHYSISNDFYYAVKNLPASYVETSYMNFIEKWGTHIIVGADLGGRLIDRYKSTYKQLYEYASSHVKSSVSGGGSYSGFGGSLSVDVNTFNQHVSDSATFGSEQRGVSSGSKIIKSQGQYQIDDNNQRPPIPIRMSVVPIPTALDQRLWTQLPETGHTYTSLGVSTKLHNLKRALSQYPTWSGAPTSSDPTVRIMIPNEWPDGTYSLPRPHSGCPSGGSQFSWHGGWRYHDTEDSNNNNQFSSPLTLAGSFGNNIKVEYCTKTHYTSNDYGIQWPKGSYCIAKKGNCPSGFSDGSIYWDDEDSNNSNNNGGTLPDGDYNSNTRTYFCCRNDGFPTNSITLPTDRPFYLYRKHTSDGCQRVRGMHYREEWVRWDDEDSRNANSKSGDVPFDDGGSGNHKLHYCYYYP